MNLREVNDYLVGNGYIITVRGKPILTNKYFRDIISSVEVPISNLPVVQDSRVVKAEKKAVNLAAGKTVMKKFAEDAYVPFRVEDGRGGQYTVKTYSEQGVKAFVTAMDRVAKGELDYAILCASTRLYYTKGTYKKTLSNYFIEDVWEGEYMEFKKKLDEGKVEQHIKKGLGKGDGNTLDL